MHWWSIVSMFWRFFDLPSRCKAFLGNSLIRRLVLVFAEKCIVSIFFVLCLSDDSRSFHFDGLIYLIKVHIRLVLVECHWFWTIDIDHVISVCISSANFLWLAVQRPDEPLQRVFPTVILCSWLFQKTASNAWWTSCLFLWLWLPLTLESVWYGTSTFQLLLLMLEMSHLCWCNRLWGAWGMSCVSPPKSITP